MSYKTELHCHTSEFSWCSNQSGADKAEMYIEKGYTTVVVTNHFCPYYPDHKDHEAFVKRYFEAADTMRQAAQGRLNVITGMELTFKESGNDYLVYGMTEEMLLDMPDILDMGHRRFFEWANINGVLLIQAHPLRFGIETNEPWYLHGIEVFNGGHHDFCNKAAEAWADIYDKEFNTEGRRFIRTSGSDHHNSDQLIRGGIVTDTEIKNVSELIDTLKSGNYTLIREERK